MNPPKVTGLFGIGNSLAYSSDLSPGVFKFETQGTV